MAPVHDAAEERDLAMLRDAVPMRCFLSRSLAWQTARTSRAHGRLHLASRGCAARRRFMIKAKTSTHQTQVICLTAPIPLQARSG
jgi:hypothetical protein